MIKSNDYIPNALTNSYKVDSRKSKYSKQEKDKAVEGFNKATRREKWNAGQKKKITHYT